MPVYISSNCITGVEVKTVFEDLTRAGLKNIELGARALPEGTPLLEVTGMGCNLLAHNYFINPSEPIILNLASSNNKLLRTSREYIFNALDFCYGAGIDLFTIHAGFRADPDLSLKFDTKKPIPEYKKSFDIFVNSVKDINDYARRKGIRVGIENNVLSEANLVNGKNELGLLCEAHEFDELWKRIPSDNLGMLLDLGHLKVTAHSLGFDRYEFIEKVKYKVFAMHIHDNNELVDEHKMLGKESWCLDIIKRPDFKGLPIILESLGLSINDAVQQVKLIENTLEIS